MKKSLHTLLALLAGCLFVACTHNNGNIGSIFGKWKLVAISAENADPPQIDGTMFWSFQNSTIEMQLLGNHQEESRTYGNWRVADQTLFLDFPDADMPPIPACGLPNQAELQILNSIDNKMILVFHPSQSQSITYSFVKY